MSAETIAGARADADAARARLVASVQALQARLSPAAVAEQVRAEVKRKSSNAAEEVVAAARRRPVAIGAAAAGLAAFLIAPPLLRRGRRNKDGADAPRNGDEDHGREARGEEGRKRAGRRGR